MNINFLWINKPTGCIKLLNLVLNIICVALLANYGPIYRSDMTSSQMLRHTLLVTTTTGGFLMTDLLLVLGYTTDNAHGKLPHQELCEAIAAAVMNLATGAVTIHNVLLLNNGMSPIEPALQDYIYGFKSYGGLCIVNAAVYIIHFVFVLKLRISSSTSNLYQREVD